MSVEWVRSSFCGNTTCVDVRFDQVGGLVLVRNGADPGLFVAFSRAEWAAFIEGVEAGEFGWPHD